MDNTSIQIINAPLDLGASKRGANAGPNAMRTAGLSEALTSIGYDVLNEISITEPSIDRNSITAKPIRFKRDILKFCKELALVTRNSMDCNTTPLVIGGDHSIAMGTVSGVSSFYQEKQQKLGLIWFDAHGDMNTPETSPSGNAHGMPLAHLLGYGDRELSNIYGDSPALSSENVVLIGCRDIDALEHEVIRDSGVTIFTMSDIEQQGITEITQRALDIASRNTAGFHLSFDVDGCDPAVMPGTGLHVPGGVSYGDAIELVTHCTKSGHMVSMEIVELNPSHDIENTSAERMVALIKTAFGAPACQR